MGRSAFAVSSDGKTRRTNPSPCSTTVGSKGGEWANICVLDDEEYFGRTVDSPLLWGWVHPRNHSVYAAKHSLEKMQSWWIDESVDSIRMTRSACCNLNVHVNAYKNNTASRAFFLRRDPPSSLLQLMLVLRLPQPDGSCQRTPPTGYHGPPGDLQIGFHAGFDQGHLLYSLL